MSHRTAVISAAALLSLALFARAETFRFADDRQQQRLTVLEGDSPVLTYNYGPQRWNGVDKKYTASCFIHPLYSLDGKVLTEAFTKDHPHHRGVWWAWPNMKARGQDVATWLPFSLPQRFVRWTERQADAHGATLGAENEWLLEGEQIGRESVEIRVQPATDVGRPIDLKLTFQAVGGPVKLFGERYGGFNVRIARERNSGEWTTSAGYRTGDVQQKPFRWVDSSTKERADGFAVFVPPTHPDYPPKWLLRSSYGAVECIHWPAAKPFTLRPGEPLTLNYRIYVHRGDAKAGQVAKAFNTYVKEQAN